MDYSVGSIVLRPDIVSCSCANDWVHENHITNIRDSFTLRFSSFNKTLCQTKRTIEIS